MATRSSGNKVAVSIVGETENVPRRMTPQTPFRIALLGNFSGQGGRGVVETESHVGARRAHRIDRDNFAGVFARLRVEIRIPILGQNSPPVAVRFSGLDDFHPDHLFDKLDVFEALKETRESLNDPAVVSAIPKEFGPTADVSRPSGAAKRPLPSGDLLQQILDAAEEPSPSTPIRPPSDVQNFVRQTANPYSISGVHPAQAELSAKVDKAIGELMRKILRHPDFQALEAAWRGVHFLVSRLETDENLKLYVIDISKDDLAADLANGEDIAATDTYKLLYQTTTEPGITEPWSLLAGNYIFDSTPEDAALAARLAKLGSTLETPFIAAAHSRLLGCASLVDTPDPDDWKPMAGDRVGAAAWASLRKLPEAGYIGLALPRILLRLPYGKETEPIERFEFEEVESVPKHEEYLWGNPAYACAYLIAQAFSEHGWDFHPGMIQEIGGLPLHVYQDQGEARATPCAEVILTQRAAEAILDRGPMPLLSFRDQDHVRLARFQSIADPLMPLRGKWS